MRRRLPLPCPCSRSLGSLLSGWSPCPSRRPVTRATTTTRCRSDASAPTTQVKLLPCAFSPDHHAGPCRRNGDVLPTDRLHATSSRARTRRGARADAEVPPGQVRSYTFDTAGIVPVRLRAAPRDVRRRSWSATLRRRSAAPSRPARRRRPARRPRRRQDRRRRFARRAAYPSWPSRWRARCVGALVAVVLSRGDAQAASNESRRRTSLAPWRACLGRRPARQMPAEHHPEQKDRGRGDERDDADPRPGTNVPYVPSKPTMIRTRATMIVRVPSARSSCGSSADPGQQ